MEQSYFHQRVIFQNKGEVINGIKGVRATIDRDQDFVGVDVAIDHPDRNAIVLGEDSGGNASRDDLFKETQIFFPNDYRIKFPLDGRMDDLIRHPTGGDAYLGFYLVLCKAMFDKLLLQLSQMGFASGKLLSLGIAKSRKNILLIKQLAGSLAAVMGNYGMKVKKSHPADR